MDGPAQDGASSARRKKQRHGEGTLVASKKGVTLSAKGSVSPNAGRRLGMNRNLVGRAGSPVVGGLNQ